MRFTIIYRNNKEIRDKVIPLLLSAINQGNDLEKNPINHQLFSSRTSWLDMQTLLNIPLDFQCEEIDFIDGSIRTRRMQVIDVEVVIEANNSIDKVASPS